ncbi:MAG: hypothetical protein K2N66_01200, partial [Paramuribaculum sp.]|nr:hypothetical protein [Paramuribaculum sp.]
DSIQASLDNFDNKLWVPSLAELTAAREAATDSVAAASGDNEKTTPSRTRSRTAKAAAKKSKAKTRKEPKAPKAASSTATRSVRNRRK